jgi:hypothetical protein
MKRLAAILFLFWAVSVPARADELPTAWSDEPPVAWTDAKPPALTSLPPIDFDLSALRAAPAVAAPVAFQRPAIERRESHACPRCGALVLAKSGRGPEPGTHLHRCPYDGSVWFHGDK